MEYSYLSERQYEDTGKMGDNLGSNHGEKYDLWRELLGTEELDGLMEMSPSMRGYFSDRPYVTKLQEPRYPQFGTATIGKSDKRILFQPFYAEYVAWAVSQIRSQTLDNYALFRDAEADMREMIVEALQDVAMRTLIQDINECRMEGKLRGENTAKEYQYYESHVLSDQAYVRELLCEHPILERCLWEVMENRIKLIKDMINRFGQDYVRIKADICTGIDFEKVIHIHGNLSDSHNGGGSVLILELDNGYRVVYKPHSLKNEEVFQTLTVRLGEACAVPMLSYQIINCLSYGWTEYLEGKDVDSREELRKYYQRIGIYLMLTYLLGTKDVHCENLIAHGAYPVIIDVENLLSYQDPIQGDKQSQILQQLRDSVVSSGILPFFYWNEEQKGVNLSALCGREGQEYPFQTPMVCDPFTSEVHIVYHSPRSPKCDNLAKLNGCYLAPYEFLEQIMDGFNTAYEHICKNKEAWLDQLQEIEPVISRHLTSDTQRYAMVLYGAYHPMLLDDGAKRELYLNLMWDDRNRNDATDQAIVKSEIMQLLHQDIPYFYFQSDSRDLYSDGKVVVSDYFAQNPMQAVLKKVKHLSEKDKQIQMNLIRATLELEQCKEEDLVNHSIPATSNQMPSEPSKQTEESEESKGEGATWKAVDLLTQKLLQSAVYDEKGELTSWYAVHVKSFGQMGWSIHPIDYYAYDGLAGIAYYFYLLDHQSKKRTDNRYQKISEVLTGQLFEYTDGILSGERPANSHRTGLLNGESSIPYIYLKMYEIERENRYLTYAKRHVEIVLDLLAHDSGYDLLDGIAGAGILLCKLYDICGEEKYLQIAEAIATELENRAVTTAEEMSWHMEQEKPLLGMAHGTSGVAYFFGMLWKYTKQEKYLHLIERILNYEDARFNAKTGNWYDYRIPEGTEAFEKADPIAWCHGAGGILISRLWLEQLGITGSLQEKISDDIQKATKKLKEMPYRDGTCLCHGTAGNMWILRLYNQSHFEEGVEACISEGDIRLIGQILDEKIVPQEKYNPGIMSGYMGAALYLLHKLQ